MHAFKAAKRVLLPLVIGALMVAGPAVAGDSGYLGVMLQDLSPAMAKALQLDDQSGVLVSEVVDDSPAAKAGLLDGDVIIAFAGESLADNGALTRAVREAKPGDKVEVTVLRDGQKKTINVELGERQNDFAWFTPGSDDDVKVIMKGLHGGDGDFEFHSLPEDRGWLGVQFDDVSPQLGEYFGVKDGEGVLVTEVVEESPAAKAGLMAGDVIVRMGTTEVEDTGDLREALAGTKAEDKIDVEYVRKGKTQSADVTLAEAPEHENVFPFGDHGFHAMAPKMMHRFLAPGGHDVRVMGAPDHRVEIIREMDAAGEDLKEMRQELDKMRDELEEMRQELKQK